jgi:hypothetical protein
MGVGFDGLAVNGFTTRFVARRPLKDPDYPPTAGSEI